MGALDLDHVSRIYGRWGRHPQVYRAATWTVFLGRERQLRRRAVAALRVEPGATVLDLACGTGANFPALEEAVGPTGRLIGLDYSEQMLASAERRAASQGWTNVELVRADAAREELPAGPLDGATCTLGLSAFPAHRPAIAKVHAALAPGASFVVLDAQPFPGYARVLNPLIEPIFMRTTNWDPERDLIGDLAATFAEVEVEEFNGRSLFIATATRSAGADGG